MGGDPFPNIDLTIEYVMPKVLNSAWAEKITLERHKQLRDTRANLVPLSGDANSEMGRKS